MKKRVVILSTQSGDWEGLYIDGKLIDEGHVLGEGNHRLYMVEQSEIYNFKLNDIVYEEINDDDDMEMNDSGRFPEFLSDLIGSYGDVNETDTDN